MIHIVAGLPRSGTSMMMRILHTGGMAVLTDDIRKADSDNPRGYYELEKVKQIKKDTSWLGEGEGKVFKMVSMLLLELPSDRRYKIIFMKRHLDEILASQARMLKNLNQDRNQPEDAEIRRLFEAHLDHIDGYLAGQDNMDVLYVSHREVIEGPRAQAERINQFLDLELDVDRMVDVVEPALYRNRRD